MTGEDDKNSRALRIKFSDYINDYIKTNATLKLGILEAMDNIFVSRTFLKCILA